MRTFDISPLLRSSIGLRGPEPPSSSSPAAPRTPTAAFPPYNIEKVGDGAYRIAMAVAGFTGTSST